MMSSPLILLALLCCAVGCAAAGDEEIRCMYDEVAKNSGAMPARIVELGPDVGKVKGAAMSAGTAGWEAMRFTVFSEDLNDPSRYCSAKGEQRPTFNAPLQTTACSDVDIFTDEKKNTLLTFMIPAAVKLHSDRLLVQRVSGKIVVPRYTQGYCGSFILPESHVTDGVANTDMVMYVAAGPTGSPRAFAGFCSRATNTNRPVSGFMNVGPAIIGTGNRGVRVAAHEMAHALGFDFETMRSFNMVSTVSNIRGQDRVLVTSAGVVAQARAYYNCPTAHGMELENEGGSGTALSHWERRNARDELMAGIAGAGYYTAATMATFEATGYFKANWGMEESMEWGRNAGCAFLEEKCVKNGTTDFPEMFCTDPSLTRVCSFDRKAIGKCAMARYTTPLPAEYQYFHDPSLGGINVLFDFCPTVEPYANTGCKDGDAFNMPGSRVGANSLCLKGEGLRVRNYADDAVQDICAEISCKDAVVRVRYAGNDTWHDCPAGTRITPSGSFTAGRILCPRYSEVCGSQQGITVTSKQSTIDNNDDAETLTTSTIDNKVDAETLTTSTIDNNVDAETLTTSTMDNKVDAETLTTNTTDNKLDAKSSTTSSLPNTDDAKSRGTGDALDAETTTATSSNNRCGEDDYMLTSTKRPEVEYSANNGATVVTEEQHFRGSGVGASFKRVTKTVYSTVFKVDSTQYLNCCFGNFFSLCASLFYIFSVLCF